MKIVGKKGVKKINFMKQLFEEPIGQTIVFVNKKITAEKIKEFLDSNGDKSHIIIGGMDATLRDKTVEGFRNCEFKVLIATNVLARGLDIPEVDLVINYNIPFVSQYGWKEADSATYLHRVGRTGRFGTDGLALSIYTNETE